ncbi:CRISPR-associated helicase Cas3' [Clostridium sp. CMCC3677]|uniref:CRISPR-associated helicase Cas3' n=1 Tax=Clostridium sp. CMCC3677 TaxID=2949963 RepID=UPI0020798C2B
MDLSIYKAKPNKTIRQHTDELLANLETLQNFNYIKDNYVYKLTKVACEYHDYGKANREFQKRIQNNSTFNENTEMAHNVLSLYFINQGEFENKEDYYKVVFAVLYHHNYCDNLIEISNQERKQLAKKLLSDFEIYSIKISLPTKIKNISKDRDAILIKGLLNKCDYSASGEMVIEYINDFLVSGLNNLLNNWKKKNPKANWNELQEFCIKNTDKNIIVVAQTGMGKTEAGLHWIGNNKGFFILPLKTAINSIYKRVKDDILEEKEIESRLALLHSDALTYYNNHKNCEMDIMEYYKHGKQLSIPINISTLDQLFDFVFKCPGYELKIATLSYSKIVIDEIQMYSSDLLAYLIYGIKVINKFGGKVAILTATLAPFIKDFLKDGEDLIEFEEATFINDSKRHNIKVYDSEIDCNLIYKKYQENNEKGISNKILVVCNTVKKAQQIYQELLEKGVEELNLLHSKFIKCDRAEKEAAILEFGRTEKQGSGIWISTQIVEASLDIDFDYLFTELSDINGLFQRLGRCNRKGSKTIDEYNCFVFLKIDSNLLTNGDKGFIDSKIHCLSREALMYVDGILTEKDKINIINKYLTTENLKGSDYFYKYKKFERWVRDLEPYELDKRDVKLRDIVSYDVIPRNIYEEYQREIDENCELLLDNKIQTSEKIKLKEEVKKYTVPVGRYDIEVKGKKLKFKSLQLSKYEFIDIIDCNYNELGFIRLTAQEVKGLEESFDNFL